MTEIWRLTLLKSALESFSSVLFNAIFKKTQGLVSFCKGSCSSQENFTIMLILHVQRIVNYMHGTFKKAKN